MTFKKLFKKLQQEQFDVEHYDAVVELENGETAEILSVSVDEDSKQIRFSTVEDPPIIDNGFDALGGD